MKKNKLLLFAMSVALVVAYAVYDYQSEKSQDIKKQEQSLLMGFKVDQIKKLEISAEGQDLVAEKSQVGWDVIQPVKDEGNSSAVETFLDGIATEKSKDLVKEGADIQWADFGLEPAKGKITLTNNAGETEIFSVGSIKNFQGDAFLRKNQDNRVFVVSPTWFSKLEKRPIDFRDRRLMRKSNARVQHLSFNIAGKKFELASKNDQWINPAHLDWKLDQNRVRETLTMLNATEVIEFITENKPKDSELKSWGLNQAPFELHVGLQEGKTWWIKMAGGKDRVYRALVSEPERVLKISPTDYGKFDALTADSFRDRGEPFDFDKTLVKKISIDSSVTKLTIQIDPKSELWTSEQGPLVQEKVKNLINKMDNLTLAQFADQVPRELPSQVHLMGADGKDLFSMQWGELKKVKINGVETSVYTARTSKYPKMFTVMESDIKDLQIEAILEMKKEGSQ